MTMSDIFSLTEYTDALTCPLCKGQAEIEKAIVCNMSVCKDSCTGTIKFKYFYATQYSMYPEGELVQIEIGSKANYLVFDLKAKELQIHMKRKDSVVIKMSSFDIHCLLRSNWEDLVKHIIIFS